MGGGGGGEGRQHKCERYITSFTSVIQKVLQWFRLFCNLPVISICKVLFWLTKIIKEHQYHLKSWLPEPVSDRSDKSSQWFPSTILNIQIKIKITWFELSERIYFISSSMIKNKTFQMLFPDGYDLSGHSYIMNRRAEV